MQPDVKNFFYSIQQINYFQLNSFLKNVIRDLVDAVNRNQPCQQRGDKMIILSADIGTTAMKMGIFEANGDKLTLAQQLLMEYAINTYNDGLFSNIEPEKWQKAFGKGCAAMADWMPEVDVIALSGTTPGLTAMDKDGRALYEQYLNNCWISAHGLKRKISSHLSACEIFGVKSSLLI